MAEGRDLAAAFGAVVREERKERGFSQEGFADHVGIHRTYQGLVERGKNVVTILTAARIAEGLGMPLSDLLRIVEGRLGEGERAAPSTLQW